MIGLQTEIGGLRSQQSANRAKQSANRAKSLLTLLLSLLALRQYHGWESDRRSIFASSRQTMLTLQRNNVQIGFNTFSNETSFKNSKKERLQSLVAIS